MNAGSSPQDATVHVFTNSEEEVLGYWTEERMREAKPLPIPRVPLEELGLAAPEAASPGTPTPVPPRKAGSPSTLAIPVSNPSVLPFSAVGLLYATMGGNDVVASGFVVYGSNSVFMTAAHTLYSPKAREWATSPLFSIGVAPNHVTYPVTKLATPCGWRETGDWRYDLGGGVVAGDLSSFGAVELAFNEPENSGPWTAVGFPMQPPFQPLTMYEAMGYYVAGKVSHTIGMNNNDMTYGSSGGPWLKRGWDIATGLASYVVAEYPGLAFSPYFGDRAENVWKAACLSAGGDPT